MSRNVHNPKQRYQFWEFIKTNYIESKLNDVEFAKLATEKLNFLCTTGHVYGARAMFDMPANAAKHTALKDINTLETRISKIETALQALYTQLGWIPPKS